MGYFTDVSGTIIMHIDSSCSIRTLIETLFEVKCKCDQVRNKENGTITITFSFYFFSDGVDAANQIQKFCDKVKQYDKTAYTDITANIRFF